jgi:hypothetical protein
MDIVKQFMKIGGFKTPQDLEAYGEENFFRDFPEARKYAKGGSIEAYPQTATFDNFFSYGVPPGPQYLKQGGSAYPQAQTEEQFFIPIYTDVYNPYNKAMGGSNVEMYPNAKTTPHWGPSNIFFQDGGEGQEEPEGPDRMGVLNTTGSFVANLKNKANQVNNKNAMMNAVSKYGFKNGGPLTRYQDKGAVTETTSPAVTPNYMTKDDFASSFGTAMDEYLKKIKQQKIEQMMETYGYNQMPQGNMGNFLDDYFAYTTGSPYAGSTTKGRVRVDGQRAGNFYGNMPLIKAMMPELYGKGNFEDLMKNNADFRNRADAMGLTGYKEPTGLKKLFGSREYTFNQRVPYESPTVTLDPKPKAPQNTTDMSVKDLINMVGKIPNETPTSSSDNVFRSKYTTPLMSETTPYDGVEVSGLDSTPEEMNPTPSSTITRQAPSNTESMDPNVAKKKAAIRNQPVNQAYIDAIKSISPSNIYNPGYDTQFGYPSSNSTLSSDVPYNEESVSVDPREEYRYGGYSGYKFGGSYRQGDVVYMSDDEIAEFIRNGGQIEEMD